MMHRRFLALAAVTVLAMGSARAAEWVPSWTASPQPLWDDSFPLPVLVPGDPGDRTVRQVLRVSLGGPRLRIEVSNAYGAAPLAIGAAAVALAGDAPPGAVVPGSVRPVTVSGRRSFTVPPGASALSDPVDLAVDPLGSIAVSLYLPQPGPVTTFHWDGLQTAAIAPGNQVDRDAVTDAVPTTTRPYLSRVIVEAAEGARTVVAFGDSITDGAASTLDANRRWPDFLAARLAPHNIAVLNAGISGARLLHDGMGRNALARFDRDVLAQGDVAAVVVLIGINDIAWPGHPFAPDLPPPAVDDLIAGYRQLIARARVAGVPIVGATLTPFRGALAGTPFEGYHTPEKDRLRHEVNAWIRESGAFDAVLDLDAVLRDPDDPSRLRPDYDSGDHLHASDAGNKAIADAVAPTLIRPAGGSASAGRGSGPAPGSAGRPGG
ncbi:SGNH/GDSL hydrolase family protein [Azospirillum halopraeferens]|uniref:SGNH/GDSL hydrolase family protein n=1 Tax=Azospirillum halopraeferens TaxID=34010 RepID=UPI001B3BF270|nr:SGNH/GDSL hydrolase family protein [Azospirillum halopraeferens]